MVCRARGERGLRCEPLITSNSGRGALGFFIQKFTYVLSRPQIHHFFHHRETDKRMQCRRTLIDLPWEGILNKGLMGSGEGGK